MINDKIAQIFDEIGDMLEVLGENVFRVRAYRRAGETVRNLSEDLGKMYTNTDSEIEKIPGIGKDLHSKIIEIIETGECEMHKRIMGKLSPGILDILRVRGIGPKKVKLFYEELGIYNIKKLKSAAESGALAGLQRMGEKSEKAILEALRNNSIGKERIPYDIAKKEAEAYIKYLQKSKLVDEIAYAGSLRRRKDTIGDIDILVSAKESEEIMTHFAKYKKVEQVLVAGETKSSVLLTGNVQVDLRVVPDESFGAALFYFTGPKQFNIDVRTTALRRGLKVNEYGLFDGKKMIAGKTEEDMFKGLEMPYQKPEERE